MLEVIFWIHWILVFLTQLCALMQHYEILNNSDHVDGSASHHRVNRVSATCSCTV